MCSQTPGYSRGSGAEWSRGEERDVVGGSWESAPGQQGEVSFQPQRRERSLNAFQQDNDLL